MTSFEEIIILLNEYKKKHGDCLVPQSYVTENGVRLGSIVHHIRTGARKTSESEKEILNELGFVWKVHYKLSFEEIITLLNEYKEKYGDCLVPISYVTESGVHLGNIVYNIRVGSRKTSKLQKQALNRMGFTWQIAVPFEKVVILLDEYKEKYGDCLVPISYVTESGVHLGNIVHNIRAGKRKTSKIEKEILNRVGFVWRVRQKRESNKE